MILKKEMERAWEQYFHRIRIAAAEHTEVFIYGAGMYGKRLCQELAKRQITVTGFCVTKLGRIKEIYGKKICTVNSIVKRGGDRCTLFNWSESTTQSRDGKMLTTIRYSFLY